jgi:hypothetical protein
MRKKLSKDLRLVREVLVNVIIEVESGKLDLANAHQLTKSCSALTRAVITTMILNKKK